MKFVPIDDTTNVIGEVDLESIFALTKTAYKLSKGLPYLKSYEFNGEEYTVNLGNVRYHVLNRDRRCQCCGIIGNRMFLCRYLEDKKYGYTFHLYAETRDKPNAETHLVRLTKDHIELRREGGDESVENLRTLCISCNNLRDMSGCSIEQMQQFLFVAHRIYRSSFTVQQTREKLHKVYRQKEKCEVGVGKITEAMPNVTDENRCAEMAAKILRLGVEAIELEQFIMGTELAAQISGVVYEEPK